MTGSHGAGSAARILRQCRGEVPRAGREGVEAVRQDQAGDELEGEHVGMEALAVARTQGRTSEQVRANLVWRHSPSHRQGYHGYQSWHR